MSNPIDLANTAPFTLDQLHVNPSTLEIANGERRETLEPRIMQVFVALYRRRGEVVSRDELIADCWDGRSVGDDAINRCIARLRRLAEAEGGYAIETIPRVGYRLLATAEPKSTGPVADDDKEANAGNGPAPWWKSRTAAIAAVLVLAVSAAAAGWFWLAHERAPSNRVAVLSFEALGVDKNLSIFGEAVAEQIIGVLNENQVQAVSRAQVKSLRGPDRDSAAGKLGADFILDGTVQRAAAGLHVIVHLDRASTHTTLWTASFDQSGEDAVDLQSQVAARAVDEIKAALRAASTGDDVAIAAYLKAQENARESGKTATTLRHDQMRIVVARAPDFSAGQSGLAVSAAKLSQISQGPDVAALRQEAQSAITRALALDPKNGEAYFAKAMLAPFGDYGQQEAIFRQGLAVDPDEPTLNSSLGALMDDVGRFGDALTLQRRAVMLDPLSPRKTTALAALEALSGNTAEARVTIDRAAKLWPADLNVWSNRLVILALIGNGQEVRDILNAPERLPAGLEPDILAAIRIFTDYKSTDAAARARAERQLFSALDAGRINFETVIALLARLGDVDASYALTGRYFTAPNGGQLKSRPDTSVLLRAETKNLRQDSRFLPMVEHLHLMAYWKAHGAPDFCKTENNPVCTELKARAPR